MGPIEANYREAHVARRLRLFPPTIPTTVDNTEIRELRERLDRAETAVEALEDQIAALTDQIDNQAPPPRPTLASIASEVAAAHGLSVNDIAGLCRHKRLCRARFEFAWRARNETLCSFPMIGRFLGGRDHSTVMHAVKRYQAMIEAGEVEG